jgi:alpha-galactosidase
MTTNTASTVMNPEIIAVDQDALGKQAWRVGSITHLDVWVKPLQGNSWAVGLYNRSETSADITVHWTDLGLPSTANVQIRDLWAKRDLGSYADHYTGTVAPHECVVLKIFPSASNNIKAEAKK